MQPLDPAQLGTVRTDWTPQEAEAVHALPFNDLLLPHAQRVHRQHFEPNKVQISTLLGIKTERVPRTAPTARRACATRPVSRVTSSWKSPTSLPPHVQHADGATRFCMGAAYPQPGSRASSPSSNR